MKSKSNTAIVRHSNRGISLVTAIVVCLSGAAFATDWNGSVDSDWNNNANWNGNAGTGGTNAVINISTPNIATITANIAATPVDIIIGSGGGTNGRLDHLSGNAATGGGNWMFAGNGGGNGVYNLADTTGTGGTLTGYAKGTGNMACSGRFWVGGVPWNGGGTGTVNVNTSGTFSMNDLTVGNNGGTGVMNVDAGTINTTGWNFVGKNDGGGNATGTLKMSGGTLSNTGRTFVGHPGCTGTMILSGGTYKNVNNETFIVGGTLDVETWFGTTGGTGYLTIDHSDSWLQSNGEFWIGNRGGTGTMTFSAGLLTTNNWTVVGRSGGNGTVTMTGGTFTKTGGGNFIVGDNSVGVMTQTNGDLTINGELWIGHAGSGNGTYTFGGGNVSVSGIVAVGREGGTGTVNFNGGTLRVSQLNGGTGNAIVNFNGTQIIATGFHTDFISNLDAATLGASGLLVNSNGFNQTIPQILGGTGGVVKSGGGILTLTGANFNTGVNSVNAGKLAVTTYATASGDYTVADGATLGVSQKGPGQSVTAPNVTLGSAGATTLDLDLGTFAGNPAVAPLVVPGVLTLNGPVTVNVADLMPALGTIPLVSYIGPKAGAGSFLLGTLPNGVVATLVEDAGLLSLNVTSASLPRWTGGSAGVPADGVWDLGITANWTDMVTNTASTYTDPAPVLFDDTATGQTVMTLDVTVAPSKVTFNNSLVPYFLSGGGKITGGVSLLKQGNGSVSISVAGNDFTGGITLEGGATTVRVLANGGSPSSIGASPAAPSSIVLNGGTLNYNGVATTSDRGFTIVGANSGISTTNDLTLSGPVVSTGGNLTKAGVGNLILSNAGANVFGGAGQISKVNGGTLTLDGSGTQTNSIPGELWIGSVPDVPAALVLNNTSLTTGFWVALGRGNGATGTTSSLTATNSTLQTVNFSTGYNAGLPNDSDQIVTLTNTTWLNNGATLLAESENATTTMTVGGTSSFTSATAFQAGIGTSAVANVIIEGSASMTCNAEILLGIGTNSVANLTIQGSGSLIRTAGWTNIGQANGAIVTVTVKDNGSFTTTNDWDFNVSDSGTSQGILNISDAAIVTTPGIAFIGKNSGTNGKVNQSGGTFNCSNWIPIGRYAGAIGVVNVTGGAFNQTAPDRAIIVGELGTGTLNISGTGAVNASGNMIYVTNGGGSIGTVNLNGGTLTTKQVIAGAGGAGLATFNFNGGLLKAGTGANATFMTGMDAVVIQVGGAFVDSNDSKIAIDQIIADDGTSGGLTKSGTGTLYLNGACTYAGPTQVTAGTLGGTGYIAGPIIVGATGDLNPGVTTGVLKAESSVTFAMGGTLTIDIAAQADTLDANALDISNAKLVLNGTPTRPVYVIARYVTLTGTFASEPVLPPGYSINYTYTANALTEIAITRPLTAYESWAKAQISDIDPSADASAGGDPDGDGSTNMTEFALDGNPLSGAASGKVVGKVASVGGNPTLVITLPVRKGATFSGATEQVSDLVDGLIYKVQGSDELATWNLAVSEVTGADKGVIELGMPPLSIGWNYWTFQSPGTITDDPAEFLRAVIATP